MASNILSQDFLGICLYLTGGDINVSLDDVALAAARFQEEQNRHFGINRDEFNLMLLVLIFQELSMSDDLESIQLRKIAPSILHFHDVHSKDTETYWFGRHLEDSEDNYERFNIRYWNSYSKEEYVRKIAVKQAMTRFFTMNGSLGPDLIKEFMIMHGIDKKLLYHCSRPGISS